MYRSVRVGSRWCRSLLNGLQLPPHYLPRAPSCPSPFLTSSSTTTTVRSVCSAAPNEPKWGTPTADNSQYEHLYVTFQDGVRTITFNRPEKKNALNEKVICVILRLNGFFSLYLIRMCHYIVKIIDKKMRVIWR